MCQGYVNHSARFSQITRNSGHVGSAVRLRNQLIKRSRRQFFELILDAGNVHLQFRQLLFEIRWNLVIEFIWNMDQNKPQKYTSVKCCHPPEYDPLPFQISFDFRKLFRDFVELFFRLISLPFGAVKSILNNGYSGFRKRVGRHSARIVVWWIFQVNKMWFWVRQRLIFLGLEVIPILPASKHVRPIQLPSLE